jgi:hypothetical protein
MTDNLVRMPYTVASRQSIEKLIQIGLLRPSRRHDAKAVEKAVEVLRQRSQQVIDSMPK